MTTAEQIQARLNEFHVVYQDIHICVAERKKLRQAEQAQAEYRRETSGFDGELAELSNQKSDLETRLRKLKIREEKGAAPSFRLPPMRRKPRLDLPPKLAEDARPQPPAGNQSARGGARLELQRLIGKYGRMWRLSGEARGSINRIAEDPARPLGEALALLDWTTFANQIAHREGETEHLKRLEDWGQALVEYRDWLSGEMDMLRTKYRRVLPIIAAWIERESDDGQRRWNQQVSETLAAKQTEIRTLKNNIDQLRTEIEAREAHR